ncbi:MAG: FAD-dependent oxidoreductase, partial [Coriobacteriia bacterium]|nr:FAD-dependent oxidoreductase [Coriobacteriia bacterium]
MSDSTMSRRTFVAGASAMAALAFAGTALAEEAPAGSAAGDAPAEGGAPAGEGGPGAGGPGGPGGGPGGPGGGAPKDIEAAKAAAKAEGRTFGYAGAGDWLGEPEQVTVAREVNDFDVVVIGGGHAGVQATLAAAEAGAKVALCEKNFAMTFLGEDIAAWNPQFNIDAGFPQYNLGEVIDEFTTRTGGRVSQEVLAAYVN